MDKGHVGFEAAEEKLSTWLNSGDEFMISLAKVYIEEKYVPTEEDAVKMLTFLSMCVLCCNRVNLPELRNVYDRRASLYYAGLRALGFKSIRSTQYMSLFESLGAWGRVLLKSSFRIGRCVH